MNRDRDVEASRSFLDSERATAPRPSSSGERRSPIQELIKCFCGTCESWFKRKSIEYALKANGDELLGDPESREILKKFLIHRQKTKNLSQAQLIVSCYELSQAIVNGEKDLEENRADIDDLCYTEEWEDRLTNAIDDGTTDDFFHDLMRESGVRLVNDPQFAAFKEALRQKLA